MFKFIRKYLLLFIIASAIIFSGSNFAFAQSNQLQIDFFYSETCPHCIAEQEFLNKIENQYPQILINRHPINTQETQVLLKEMSQEYGVDRYVGLVPLTFVGGDFFLGFDSEQGVGKQIKESIIKQIGKDNKDITMFSGAVVSLPFMGEINMQNYSLPLLAVILGFLDGFNICSLGALVLILALVLAFHSRLKIIILGLTFIVTTALIYGFLIGFWYKMFSLLAPYLRVMEILIGVLGVAGGIYFLKQFLKFRKQGPICEIDIKNGLVAKFSNRLENSFKENKSIFLIILTVLFFAALITVVEFPCSAAIPVMFAGLMAKSGISFLSYLFYLSIYLLFYMLDEIIVFLIAVFNMKLWMTNNKYVVWITLTEAIILLIFGFYYLVGF